MENNIQYRMYRCSHADGRPWKDWLIAETARGGIEVWFGASDAPLRHLEVSSSKSMVKRIAEQEQDGYVYLGQAEVKNRRPQLVQAADPAQPVDPIEAIAADTDDIRLFWTLSDTPRPDLLQRVRDLAAELPEWVTAAHAVSAGCVEIESKAFAPWRLDLTPDGLHNAGQVPAACGPAPVLILLRLARDGDLFLSGAKGEDIDAARFNSCQHLFQFDGVPPEAVVEAAGRLGLVLRSLSGMRINRRDAWL